MFALSVHTGMTAMSLHCSHVQDGFATCNGAVSKPAVCVHGCSCFLNKALNSGSVHLSVQIWMQTKSCVSHFVAGGSTGGTISGTGRFLKDMNPNIKVMLPDPVGSVFWDYWANRMAQKELKPKSYQVCTLPVWFTLKYIAESA